MNKNAAFRLPLGIFTTFASLSLCAPMLSYASTTTGSKLVNFRSYDGYFSWSRNNESFLLMLHLTFTSNKTANYKINVENGYAVSSNSDTVTFNNSGVGKIQFTDKTGTKYAGTIALNHGKATINLKNLATPNPKTSAFGTGGTFICSYGIGYSLPVATATSSLTYTNQKYGFTVKLPSSWAGHYLVVQRHVSGMITSYDFDYVSQNHDYGKILGINLYGRNKLNPEDPFETMITVKNGIIFAYSEAEQPTPIFLDGFHQTQFNQMQKMWSQIPSIIKNSSWNVPG